MDFYLTPVHPCGYLADHYSVNIFADPNAKISTHTYSRLIDHGFRRNGVHLYRPQCPNCSACVPTRICVNNFKANRSQLRCLRLNTDIKIKHQDKNYNQEHYRLYKQYVHQRHTNGPMDESTKDDYKNFILGSWSDTRFLEFHLNEKLICVAVYDALPQGISAVYTFYDTNYSKRGLGTLAILKLIEEAANKNLSYVYLGYWINACNKMSYKKNFKPIEGYINRVWQLL